MGSPKRKEISVISPDILREAIKTRIRKFDGKTYKEKRPCPNCGATASYRNGFRERIIAKLICVLISRILTNCRQLVRKGRQLVTIGK